MYLAPFIAGLIAYLLMKRSLMGRWFFALALCLLIVPASQAQFISHANYYAGNAVDAQRTTFNLVNGGIMMRSGDDWVGACSVDVATYNGGPWGSDFDHTSGEVNVRIYRGAGQVILADVTGPAGCSVLGVQVTTSAPSSSSLPPTFEVRQLESSDSTLPYWRFIVSVTEAPTWWTQEDGGGATTRPTEPENSEGGDGFFNDLQDAAEDGDRESDLANLGGLGGLVNNLKEFEIPESATYADVRPHINNLFSALGVPSPMEGLFPWTIPGGENTDTIDDFIGQVDAAAWGWITGNPTIFDLHKIVRYFVTFIFCVLWMIAVWRMILWAIQMDTSERADPLSLWEK